MAALNEVKKAGEPQRVEIEIFGEIYRLKTDDPQSLAKLAQMVDSTMKSISQNTRTFAGSRIAVLAALKIAEDYMQLKKDYEELLALLDEHK
ncbi:MAG: cell division protein ZapA [Selenomonadaceae bacterium]|nr:cell division protein ZapA [Selenomonadaceae bacterium]